MALERNDAKVMNFVVFKAGVPTETAARGTLCIDTTNGKLYINTNGSTTWAVVGTQT